MSVPLSSSVNLLRRYFSASVRVPLIVLLRYSRLPVCGLLGFWREPEGCERETRALKCDYDARHLFARTADDAKGCFGQARGDAFQKGWHTIGTLNKNGRSLPPAKLLI